MKTFLFGLMLSSLLMVAGCSRNEPLAPLSVADLPTQAPKVFADAPPAVRQLVDAGVKATVEHHPTQAWSLFQKLAGRPELTKAQQDFAARAVMALSEEVTRAADAGDREASRMKKAYGASK